MGFVRISDARCTAESGIRVVGKFWRRSLGKFRRQTRWGILVREDRLVSQRDDDGDGQWAATDANRHLDFARHAAAFAAGIVDDSSLAPSSCLEVKPFLSRAGLHEHLQRCIEYTLQRTGPHGPPLIGRADWNDCLNLNSDSETPGESFQTAPYRETGVAESIFIAGLFVLAAGEMAQIAAGREDAGEADRCRVTAATMRRAVDEHGWDGDWLRRAYDRTGAAIGSAGNAEGRIFVEPQGMCVMAGIGVEDGRAAARARGRAGASRHAARHHASPARLHAVPCWPGRDHLVPTRLQGERRHLLPHEPMGDDRGDHPGPRRRRGGLLPAAPVLPPARRSRIFTGASRTCTPR